MTVTLTVTFTDENVTELITVLSTVASGLSLTTSKHGESSASELETSHHSVKCVDEPTTSQPIIPLQRGSDTSKASQSGYKTSPSGVEPVIAQPVKLAVIRSEPTEAKTAKTCSVEGCYKPAVHGKAHVCGGHKTRISRYGSPLAHIPLAKGKATKQAIAEYLEARDSKLEGAPLIEQSPSADRETSKGGGVTPCLGTDRLASGVGAELTLGTDLPVESSAFDYLGNDSANDEGALSQVGGAYSPSGLPGDPLDLIARFGSLVDEATAAFCADINYATDIIQEANKIRNRKPRKAKCEAA